MRKLLRRFLQAAPPSQIAKRKLNLETLEARDVPNATAHVLAGSNFSQNWTNTGLITTNNDWSNVPSIVGYRGEGLTSTIGADPQTLIADITSSVYVLANRTNPNLTTGGVGEFQLSNPVIALQGSGTADAPNIVLNLDATGRKNLTVSYILRDIDGSVNNAVSPVALQYRVGSSGFWTNVATKFVADASQGGQAGLETFVSTVLPSAVNNQGLVQIRVITSNAAGYDEWIGIDDISVTSASSAPPIAVNDNYSTIHNQPMTVSGSGLLGNDTATGGATSLTATPQTNVATAHGFVTVQSNGGFTYTPNAGYVGTDSFGYQVNDNFGNTASATASINVTNAAPTAQNFEFSTNRATPVTANLLTGSADADGDQLTVNIPTGPYHGQIELDSSTGAFKYTPALDWLGIETIVFNVRDGFGGTTVKAIDIDIRTGYVADYVSYFAAADTTNTLVLNLTDGYNGSVMLHSVGAASHGTLIFDSVAGTITYTPVNGYVGVETVNYSTVDSLGDISVSTLSISISNKTRMLDAFFVPRNASNNFIDLLHKWWEIKDLAYNNAIAKANFEIERYIEIIQTIQGIDAQLAADPTNQLLIFLKDTWTQIRFAQFSIMTSSIQDLRTAYAVLSDSYADYLASWTQAEKLAGTDVYGNEWIPLGAWNSVYDEIYQEY